MPALLLTPGEFQSVLATSMVPATGDSGTSIARTEALVTCFEVRCLLAVADFTLCFWQGWVAVIVFVTVASYLPLTVIVTEWRGRVRKKMNAMDNAMGARATDMLLNYETVRCTVYGVARASFT